MLTRGAITGALLVCFTVPCAAQWTLGAYLGGAHTQDSYLRLQQPSLATDLRFSGVSYRGESFQSPFYYGVRGGYFFSRHFGAEVEFTHLKVFANVSRSTPVSGTLNGAAINTVEPINTVIQGFSISHGVNLLLANAVFREPLGQSGDKRPRAMVEFRFGAGTTIPHAESIIEENPDQHYQVGSPAIQLASALEIRLWHRLYWSGEYKFTRVREQVSVYSGTVTSLLLSHHLVTGPVFHF
jgi:hypothetical protein